MKTVGCVLLMGGKSSRMGRDKAYLLHKGIPFWKIIVQEMMQCGETYISLDSMKRAPETDCSLILDEYSSIGPMGGIYSGLLHAKEEIVFFAPCDMPIITAEMIRAIIAWYKDEYDGIILAGRDGKCYPTIGVYSRRLLPVLKERIRNKDYRLMGLLDEKNVKVLPIETLNIPKIELMNLNTWDDYLKFERIHSRKAETKEPLK